MYAEKLMPLFSHLPPSSTPPRLQLPCLGATKAPSLYEQPWKRLAIPRVAQLVCLLSPLFKQCRCCTQKKLWTRYVSRYDEAYAHDNRLLWLQCVLFSTCLQSIFCSSRWWAHCGASIQAIDILEGGCNRGVKGNIYPMRRHSKHLVRRRTSGVYLTRRHSKHGHVALAQSAQRPSLGRPLHIRNSMRQGIRAQRASKSFFMK